jgi:hypothetical protein
MILNTISKCTYMYATYDTPTRCFWLTNLKTVTNNSWFLISFVSVLKWSSVKYWSWWVVCAIFRFQNNQNITRNLPGSPEKEINMTFIQAKISHLAIRYLTYFCIFKHSNKKNLRKSFWHLYLKSYKVWLELIYNYQPIN